MSASACTTTARWPTCCVEWRGEPVSLYVVPDRSDGDQILEIVGHDAVIWSQSDSFYVLVSEKGPVEIAQAGQYVRQYTD